MMMQSNEKRRAIKNATERLHLAGAQVVALGVRSPRPILTVKFPPEWLSKSAIAITEQHPNRKVVSHVAKLSGCVIRWI